MIAPGLEKSAQGAIADLWTHPGLSPRDRSIVTLAALIARGQTIEMPYQVGLALDNGVKPREISEIITHLAFYSGWGNALSAIPAAKEVFARRNVGADQLAPASGPQLPLDAAAEAQRVVDAVKYPPAGKRGFGIRGILTDFQAMTPPQAMAKIDAESIVIVQVESGAAIDELPYTVRIPGIDAIMVGPNDLSISLGLAGEFGNPKFQDALERIAKACAGSPVAAGIHLGDEKRLLECKAMGYRLLNFSSDMAMLTRQLKDSLKTLRGAPSTGGDGPKAVY